MLVLVESVVSERDWGVILSVTKVDEPESKFQVKALAKLLLGSPSVGETWNVEGEFTRSSAFGLQLLAQSGYRKTPTGRLICRYLAEHVPGIGHERANRLWSKWGTDIAKIISDESNILAIASVIAPDRRNLGVRLAAEVVRAWTDSAAESNLVDWLAQRGIDDLKLSRRIAKILGDTAVNLLASNPYVLVPVLPSWRKVDKFARQVMRETGTLVPKDDVRRLVGAADSAVKETLVDGHTALSQEHLEVRLAKLLDAHEDSEIVALAIAAGERNGAILRGETGWRAPGAALLEENVLAKLRRMLESNYPCPVQVPPPERLERLLDRTVDPAAPLHDEQRSAVMKIMQHPVSCLQGGGGVGKTYTLRFVCDLFENLGGHILLGALAGKAALHLGRTTGRFAFTLARILGQLAERERIESIMCESAMSATEKAKHAERLKSLVKIDERTLVVLDEASMIDLPLLHSLLRYMPEGARLLLSGDCFQLPPISFGLVYQILVSDTQITALLSFVHRQASETGIPAISAAIRDRKTPDFNEFKGAEDSVSFVECDADCIGATVERIAIELGGYSNGVVIVAPTRKGPAGVDVLNAHLHEHHREASSAREVRGFNSQYYCVGDPVMWLRNDYARGLFNGLIGQVDSVPEDVDERWLNVLFDGETTPRNLRVDDLMDLTLAHALTCHKFQGSQASRIVVPIYESRVLDPSWIYTAITRAERQVVLVGNMAVLRSALSKPWTSEARQVGFCWSGIGDAA